MNMANPRFVLWLLDRADAGRGGHREALVGDLLEEIAHGRSRHWVCLQMIGLGWFALVAQTRRHVRVTPPLVALAISLVLIGGVSITSLSRVLETWMGFYLLAGTLSLFADVMSRTITSRALVIVANAAAAERL
jgi:hypothetical protein